MGIKRQIHDQIEALGLDSDRIKEVDIGVFNGEKVADVKLEGEVYSQRVVVSESYTPEQKLTNGLEAICTFPESPANFVSPIMDIIGYNFETGMVTANLRTTHIGKPNEKTPEFLRCNNESIPSYLRRVVDYKNPFSHENIANTFMAYLIAVLSTKHLQFNKREINSNLITQLYFIIDQSKEMQEVLVKNIDITDLVNISRFVEKKSSKDYSVSAGENTLTIKETDKVTGETRIVFERTNPNGLNKDDNDAYIKAFVEFLQSKKDSDKVKLFEGKRIYSNLFDSFLGPDSKGIVGNHVSPGRFDFDYSNKVSLKVSVE